MVEIDLKTFTDKRGNLTVIEKLPFEIKRVFYIYGVDESVRGGHRHKKTRQAVICLQGNCLIGKINDRYYNLDSPAKCLIIEPEEWHFMVNFSKDAILMVLASTEFDENDYIYPPCANEGCVCYRELYHLNNCSWFTIMANNKAYTLGKGKCPDYIEGQMGKTNYHINQRVMDEVS